MSSLPAHQFIPFGDVDQLREARHVLREASQAIAELSQRLDTRFCAAARLIETCEGAVVVTGMGKAGLIGRKITATLSSTGTRALFLHPAEAVHGDLGCVRKGDVALALSNSGETEELCRLLPILDQFGVPIVAITGRATSTLGKSATVTLELGRLREAGELGLAPTTSTTAMLALGDALALVVSRTRGFTRGQFGMFHPAGHLGKQLQCVRDLMRGGDQLRVAPETATIREVFVNRRKAGRRTGAVMLLDDEGRLSGIFTDSDLVRLLENRRESQIDEAISGAMTHCPKTIYAEAPLVDAVNLLSQHHISELPVIDSERRPIGLVDITDLISLMPEERAE
ncbi:MAG: KpsF/GutQ family sugar-phosphate isomerase [Planctomycetaceae bacterium]|nr:KpsF/GutQ family sugar-phosphate isomerase [Planctomycetaceae bacterium]